MFAIADQVRRHTFQAMIVGSVLCFGGAIASRADAATTSGTIDVELTITNACVVNGATSVSSSFGNGGKILFADQPGLFADVDGQLVGSLGNLSVKCSPGVSPTLTVGSGANDQSGNRRLKSGSNTVAYHLYSDSARLTEISVGTALPLGTLSTAAVGVPIYARVNSGGNLLPAGTYTDTVQVTLSW